MRSAAGCASAQHRGADAHERVSGGGPPDVSTADGVGANAERDGLARCARRIDDRVVLAGRIPALTALKDTLARQLGADAYPPLLLEKGECEPESTPTGLESTEA